MSQRSRFASLVDRVGQLAESATKSALGNVIERSPDMLEELRTLARHPRTLGSWIESKSPWLNRQFLGAASNLVEPFTIGMGLHVEKLGEDCIEVLLPGGWRNQGEHGTIHASALSTLGEFAARVFWEHHLDLRSADAGVTRVQVRLLARAVGDMRAVFRLPVSDREAILQRIRAEGRLQTETQTQIYDLGGRLVAEVEVDWEMQKQLLLGNAGAPVSEPVPEPVPERE